MKIKSIQLNNFQAHGDLTVELSTGITTIKGPTDTGKSAILRALGWCCLNSIAGDEFIKEGEKKSTVVVTTVGEEEFGETITRIRSAGGAINTYEMGDSIYKAFGQGVPEEIVAHLALAPINFQGQHDAPFWFAETAGEVSRQLNAIIDLSVIDSSLTYVATKVRENQLQEKLCQERLEAVVSELEELKPQHQRIEDFERLERLERTANEKEKDRNRLEGVLSSVRANKAKRLKEKHEAGLQVLTLCKASRDIRHQVEELQTLIQRVKKSKRLAQPPPNFQEVSDLFNAAKEKNIELVQLEEALDDARRHEKDWHVARERLHRAEETFHSRVKGANCPLCGNRIE